MGIFQDMLGENIVLVNVLCGVEMPDGMKENDKFPTPILTPTTKADVVTMRIFLEKKY